MSNDTDLWTVRDALAKAGNREGVAAIGRITEELTRLRNGMVPEEDLSIAHVEQDRLRAERDEAVAALRYIAEAHGPQPEAHWRNAARDALARLSTPKDPTPRIGTIMDGADGHTSAGQFVPTPKEPTDD